MVAAKQVLYHPILSQPFFSLGFTALSLLLLVLVLLSVPGPIKGLYWFTVKDEEGGSISAGVLGWCMTDTSNCTYAPLSDNPYLSTMIDTGEALIVRTILPLSCYWMIVTFLLWILLTALSPMGYKIKDLDSITRHLRFSVVESFVICMSLFGNILCWLAFGLGRTDYLSAEDGGGDPESGNAMETTAVASFISLLSLFTAVWGLHLRIRSAQAQWKEEAVMVRRRSMALCASGVVNPDQAEILGVREESGLEKRLSMLSDNSFRLGDNQANLNQSVNHRNSTYKATYQPQPQPNLQPQPQPRSRPRRDTQDRESEERLEEDNSTMITRVSLHDSPYTAAHVNPN
ncbi:uncharacterized protein IL334_001098 [Kwoniella shivajii]|uniref:Uncharacterized protein n=1 Tax=Kwoniella shivajii TaxID=564305 RepID=A0ABZ1CS28_9TREE|nr:hypothetical protein IL334_001098 [Kwoniella shivajii]